MKMIAFKGSFATIVGYLDGFGIVSNHKEKVKIYWCNIDLCGPCICYYGLTSMSAGLHIDEQMIENNHIIFLNIHNQ